jgi:hypothetical protein
MKQFYIFSLLSIFCFASLEAQTVFDWDGATTNGNTVIQTVNTITATFAPLNTTVIWQDASGFSDTEGFIVGSSNGEESVSITFSQAINVESIFAFKGSVASPQANWTFTPTGGSNNAVVASITGGSGTTVALNWVDVTEITITSSTSTDFFGVDTIISDFSLSIDDFKISNSDIKLFPNPSTDYIQITNLNSTENYKVYNVLGSEVIKGQISVGKKIDVQNLSQGMYLLKLDSGETMKFLKK